MRLTITYVPGTVKKGSIRKVSQKSQMEDHAGILQACCRPDKSGILSMKIRNKEQEDFRHDHHCYCRR